MSKRTDAVGWGTPGESGAVPLMAPGADARWASLCAADSGDRTPDVLCWNDLRIDDSLVRSAHAPALSDTLFACAHLFACMPLFAFEAYRGVQRPLPRSLTTTDAHPGSCCAAMTAAPTIRPSCNLRTHAVEHRLFCVCACVGDTGVLGTWRLRPVKADPSSRKRVQGQCHSHRSSICVSGHSPRGTSCQPAQFSCRCDLRHKKPQ